MSQNLQFLTIPDDNDWLYIVDINGGRNGVNPRTKRITYKDLLANASVDFSAIESSIDAIDERITTVESSAIAIPSNVKTTVSDTDFLIGIDNTGSLYRITKANLLAGLGNSGSSNTITFTYQSNGDTNGLIYWLGFSNGQFINPNNDKIILTASSVGSPGGVGVLTDRVANEFYSNAAPNSWVQVRLIQGQLKLRSYSLRNRFRNDGDFQYSLRNWKIQGSNNGTAWTDIDQQINNTTINGTGVWVTITLPTMSDAYSYFRITQNGETSNNNGILYLCLGEIELYGEYTY